jgi:hypothetical protein
MKTSTKFKIGDRVRVKSVPGLDDIYPGEALFIKYPHFRDEFIIEDAKKSVNGRSHYYLANDPVCFSFRDESLELVQAPPDQLNAWVTKAQNLSQELDAVYKQIFALMKEGDIENGSW